MKRPILAGLAGLAAMFSGGGAQAHVAVISPAFAGTNQEITFTVGHGCDGMDTLSVRLQIPDVVTSIRTVSSTLGPPTIERNAAELVSAITWAKPEADILPADTSYHRIVVRLRVPNAPLTKLRFLATQTCMAPNGTKTTVEWTSLDDNESETGPQPAASLTILPARVTGWNKYTVPVALATVEDLATFFGVAQIVWKGNAAFSANPLVADQIANTDDDTALDAVAAGDEIWVKY